MITRFPRKPVQTPYKRAASVNKTSELYRRNEQRFFGGRERSDSRGSVYQRNAAHFFGEATPGCGERPYQPAKVADYVSQKKRPNLSETASYPV